MARGQRKPLEEKIAEKEELIQALQVRLKSEQAELETMYQEKRLRDLEGLSDMIRTSGLDTSEVAEALAAYIELRDREAS